MKLSFRTEFSVIKQKHGPLESQDDNTCNNTFSRYLAVFSCAFGYTENLNIESQG